MSLKKTYSCDICDENKEPGSLKGVYFTAHKSGSFRLVDARETDGHHICLECLGKLKEILNDA